MLKELRREDGTVVAEEELTDYICSFFQDLFTSTAGDRVEELIDTVTPRVTVSMHDVMNVEFKRE